jgi:phospholipid/cholesterol/gamma-HCH transport system substrate-binding protein
MSRNVIETILGAVVIIAAALFLAFALTATDLQPVEGYKVTANFSNIGGITNGTDVKISGVKIGSVVDVAIDQTTYLARVTMTIRPNIELPTDSSASILSSGLLGDQYLSVSPGAESQMIDPGGEIQFTQSAQNLEQLLGKFIFQMGDGGGSDSGS